MAEKKALRLDKFLVEMGKGSRSQIKEMAKKGRIAVNGAVVRRTEEKIDPETDEVMVDRERVAWARMEYYLMNKPQGVISATEEGRHYPAVTSLLTGALRGDLFPVGRLDVDTEGLLLLTNDGALAHSLLSPKRHVDKTYEAIYEGTLPADCAEQVAQGLILEDGMKTLPGTIEVLEVGKARITIHEGKFHQVKRMFEAMGCKVVGLKRLTMGPLVLDESLKPGEYRPLTQAELQELLALGAGKEE